MNCNHRCVFNGIRQAIIRFLYRLIDWLEGDLAPAGTACRAPTTPDGEAWVRYRKLADGAQDMVAAAILEKREIAGVRVTASTGWLLWTIARRISLARNHGELSIDDLVKASGLSRDTIVKHTPVLEALGLLNVARREISTRYNAINGYALAGVAAEAYMVRRSDRVVRPSAEVVRLSDGKNQQEKIHQHDADDGHTAPEEGKLNVRPPEAATAPSDGQRETPKIPEIALRIGMDALVAARLVEGHGADVVAAWCQEATRNKGLHSPAAWAVSRIATGQALPERAYPSPALPVDREGAAMRHWDAATRPPPRERWNDLPEWYSRFLEQEAERDMQMAVGVS